MTRRLVIVGGLLAFALLAVWWFANGGGGVYGGRATPTGVVSFTAQGTRFIFTGCDTTDVYFFKQVAPGQYEMRRLPMRWEDVPSGN
jgi:hypothetical protein